MDEKALLEKLKELLKMCDGGPSPKHKMLAKKLVKTLQTSQAPQNSNGLFLDVLTVAALEESLDYFRICIKYQIFDIEAAGREIEYLKKLLKENGISVD